MTQVNRSTEQDVALKTELVEAFLETQSFRYDPDKGFKLASGQISPFYVDCRMLMAHPGPRRLVAQAAWERLRGVDFDCLGGLEIGAISIATTISDYAFAAMPRRSWRTFVVRKQAKDHGSKERTGCMRRWRPSYASSISINSGWSGPSSCSWSTRAC